MSVVPELGSNPDIVSRLSGLLLPSLDSVSDLLTRTNENEDQKSASLSCRPVDKERGRRSRTDLSFVLVDKSSVDVGVSRLKGDD